MDTDGHARRYDGGMNVTSDAFMGAIAGTGAALLLDRLDWFMYNREHPRARERTQEVRPRGKDPAHRMVDTAAEATGRKAPAQPNLPGVAMHYNLAIAPGALYGALSERVPAIGACRGALYGLALFLIQDEALNYGSGLSARPRDYPWQDHARGLIAHVAYGMALDAGLRALKRASRGAA